MGKYFGIDLGTTNSCVATIINNKPEVLVNVEGDYTTPSVIDMHKDGTFRVGKVAKEDILNQEIVVEEIKKHIGSSDYTIRVGEQAYNPTQLSALILLKLKYDIEALEKKIDGVVITVPDYFGYVERRHTECAASVAGLNILSIISESSAAVLYYLYNKVEIRSFDNEKKNILVYDLGGRNFDVALFETQVHEDNNSLIVYKSIVTCDGSTLGGKDWDQRLAELIVNKVCEQTNCDKNDLINNISVYKEIMVQAEKMKHNLSVSNLSTAYIQTGKDVNSVEITREEFKYATKDLVANTITVTDGVLDKLIEEGKKLDVVLLVGGATHMPQIKEALLADEKLNILMDEVKFVTTEPEFVVAKGAAILAASWANMIGVEIR